MNVWNVATAELWLRACKLTCTTLPSAADGPKVPGHDSERERFRYVTGEFCSAQTVRSTAIRDYGDLIEVTANVGGTFSDVPQGSPTGTGCGGGPSCFS